ncbi:MAG TPA: MFS transporter [Gaiellaceae bacterium]|nr:MFS transporter [Gaiellaceae bacterium]
MSGSGGAETAVTGEARTSPAPLAATAPLLFATAVVMVATVALYALPAYATDLKHQLVLTSTEVGLLSSGFAITYALVQVPSGIFGGMAGLRIGFGSSLALIGAGFLGSSLVHSYGALLALRALTGFGAGMLLPLASGLARSVTPTANLRSQGLITSGWGLGYVLGLLALPVAFDSWRAGFVAVGTLSLALGAYALLGLAAPARSGRHATLGDAAQGLRQRGTWLLGFCSAGSTIVNVGAGAWATSFVKDEKDVTGFLASFVPSLIGWGLLPATILGALAARRWGEVAVLRVAAVGQIASIGVIAAPADLTVFGLGLCLLGFFTGFPTGIVLALVAKIVFGPSESAQATLVGAINMAAFFGATLAPVIVGAIKDLTGHFELGFTTLLIGPVLILVATARVGRLLDRAPPAPI